MAARIRKDDMVIITTGKDRGRKGRVLLVLKDKQRVVVEGINMVTRHLKKNPQNPAKGGRTTREAPVHMSKVLPWSEAEKKGVRVKMKVDEAGKKYRASAKTGARIAAAEGTVKGARAKDTKGA